MSRLGSATVFVVIMFWCSAALADCNATMPDPVNQVSLPGHPFAAVPTSDGCTIFVSLTAKPGHIAVLKRDNGVVTLAQTVPIEGLPAGLALSPDGRLLAVARGAGALLFDASSLTNGNANPIASLGDGDPKGSVYAAFSPDGRTLVVANEGSASLSLYDVSAAPKSLGKLKVGETPVGLAFSPDGRLLYSTSELGPRSWPAKCHEEGGTFPEGLLVVFDIAKAAADSKTGMVAGVAAGCDPVRVALSADGATAYVTARGDNSVRIYDTARLSSDATHALKEAVTVGTEPVGIAVNGGAIFVTNSDRTKGSQTQSVSVLDAAHPENSQHSIQAGGFPREVKVTADGNTLLVTNFQSGSLELVDLRRLPEAAK